MPSLLPSSPPPARSIGAAADPREAFRLALRRGLRERSLATGAASDRSATLPASLLELEAAILSHEEPAPNVAPERALLGYAPLALVEGAWLRAAVRVERSHDELGAACLDALHVLFGEGDAALHRANLYRGQLAARGLALPPLAALPSDRRLLAPDFELALLPLEVGASPSLVPEALGLHVVQCLRGAPAVVRGAMGSVDLHSTRLERTLPTLRRVLDAEAAYGREGLERVSRGAALMLRARHDWLSSLSPKPPDGPWEAMASLVCAKALHSFGYHAAIRVADRPLDDWLDPRRPDVVGLLSALARSPWVVPGAPDASPLVRATAFGGPMFGIFTSAELEALRGWIRALPDMPEPPAACASRSWPLETPGPAPSSLGLAPSASERLPSARTLYHRLLVRRDDETDALARAWVEQLLGRTRGSLPQGERAGLGRVPYERAALERWVDARMTEQLRMTRAAAPLESALERHEVLWVLEQLAPAAFVDGAWLEDAAAPEHSQSSVGALLFAIYRDELGAGVVAQHHGNVMRKTLSEQGAFLPDCDARAFVERRALLPEAFSTPALWLAISRHHATYLPELCGLNLAIEMAGVGATYGRAIRLLQRHAIDPQFFRLHDAIDNAATGHTAWSVAAIGHLMEGVAASGADAEPTWARVWEGHALYALSSKPLVLALAQRLAPKLGARWLGARLADLSARLFAVI